MNIYKFIIYLLFIVIPQPKIINKPFPAHNIRDSTYNWVIIHYDSSNNPSATLAFLRHSGNSYHYLIDKDGTIYKTIDPKYEGRHAGLSYIGGRFHVNSFSIGICLVNNGKSKYTDKQYESLTWLIKFLQVRYPDIDSSRIVGHSQVAIPRGRKKDPGKYFDWNRLYTNIKQDSIIINKQDIIPKFKLSVPLLKYYDIIKYNNIGVNIFK